MSSINPRDILIFAPLLTTTAAYGVFMLIKKIRNHSTVSQRFTAVLLILAVFGLLNYIHSVLVRFVSGVGGCLICAFSSLLAVIAGLTLSQTTMQLYAVDRISFPTEYFINNLVVVAIGLLSLLLILFILISSKKSKVYVPTVVTRFKAEFPKLPQINRITRHRIPKSALILALITSVIVIPRIEIVMIQGGTYSLTQNQLQRIYGPIYNFFTDDQALLEGDILSYRAPYGMQYYIIGHNFIDLKYAANLAYLKYDLVSNSSAETVDNLANQGIRHILMNLGTFTDLDNALNNTFSNIISNSSLATLVRIYGSWELYILWPT